MRRSVALGLVLCSACGPVITDDAEVVELRVSETWVFTYTEDPLFSWQALHTGPAALKGECLTVGGFVVVWWERHLEDVGALVAAAEAGDALSVTIGGGGPPSAPEIVRETCPGVGPVWLAGMEPIQLEASN